MKIAILKFPGASYIKEKLDQHMAEVIIDRDFVSKALKQEGSWTSSGICEYLQISHDVKLVTDTCSIEHPTTKCWSSLCDDDIIPPPSISTDTQAPVVVMPTESNILNVYNENDANSLCLANKQEFATNIDMLKEGIIRFPGASCIKEVFEKNLDRVITDKAFLSEVFAQEGTAEDIVCNYLKDTTLVADICGMTHPETDCWNHLCNV